MELVYLKDFKKVFNNTVQIINLVGSEVDIKISFFDKIKSLINCQIIDTEEMNNQDIITEILSVSFLVDKKVVKVYNNKYEKYANEFCILVFVNGDATNPNISINCHKLRGNSLSHFTKQIFKENNYEISKELVKKFLSGLDGSLSKVVSEAEKLILSGKQADTRLIESMQEVNAGARMFNIFSYIIKRDSKNALTEYKESLNLGYDTNSIHNIIMYYLQKMFYVQFILKVKTKEEVEELESDIYKCYEIRHFINKDKLYDMFVKISEIENKIRMSEEQYPLFIIALAKRDYTLLEKI